MFQDISSFSLLIAEVFYHSRGMAKMNDQVPKERLGTSMLHGIFLKIYPDEPTSKFQE